jgi:hypothetical protein
MIEPSGDALTTRCSREIWTGVEVDKLAPEQFAQARVAGYEPDGKYLIGRDPRAMSQDELRAMGHEQLSPMQAIRAKCLDCAGSFDEVRKCVAVDCPSWPFRTGKNPLRQEISEELREKRHKMALRHGFGARQPARRMSESDETDVKV